MKTHGLSRAVEQELGDDGGDTPSSTCNHDVLLPFNSISIAFISSNIQRGWYTYGLNGSIAKTWTGPVLGYAESAEHQHPSTFDGGVGELICNFVGRSVYQVKWCMMSTGPV